MTRRATNLSAVQPHLQDSRTLGLPQPTHLLLALPVSPRACVKLCWCIRQTRKGRKENIPPIFLLIMLIMIMLGKVHYGIFFKHNVNISLTLSSRRVSAVRVWQLSSWTADKQDSVYTDFRYCLLKHVCYDYWDCFQYRIMDVHKVNLKKTIFYTENIELFFLIFKDSISNHIYKIEWSHL